MSDKSTTSRPAAPASKASPKPAPLTTPEVQFGPSKVEPGSRLKKR